MGLELASKPLGIKSQMEWLFLTGGHRNDPQLPRGLVPSRVGLGEAISHLEAVAVLQMVFSKGQPHRGPLRQEREGLPCYPGPGLVLSHPNCVPTPTFATQM